MDSPLEELLSFDPEKLIRENMRRQASILFEKIKADRLLVTFVGGYHGRVNDLGFNQNYIFAIAQTPEQFSRISDGVLEGSSYHSGHAFSQGRLLDLIPPDDIIGSDIPSTTGSVTGTITNKKLQIYIDFQNGYEPEKLGYDIDIRLDEKTLSGFDISIGLLETALSQENKWHQIEREHLTTDRIVFELKMKRDGAYKGKWGFEKERAKGHPKKQYAFTRPLFELYDGKRVRYDNVEQIPIITKKA